MKTIYQKITGINVLVILISYTMIIVGVNFAVNEIFLNQRESLLSEQAKVFQKVFDEAQTSGILNVAQLRSEVDALESYLGVKVLLVDRDGKVASLNDNDDKAIEIIDQSNLSVDEITLIFNGKTIKNRGYIRSVSADQILIIGSPLYYNNEVTFALFLTTSIPEINKANQSINAVILSALLISGILASVLILYFTRRMSNEIRALNVSAKYIASGNFEKRIRSTRKDELGELINNFNFMAEELHKLETMKRSFISNLSHDLRTPLQSIKGYTLAILDGTLDGTIDETRQERYLKIVLDESDRLTKMVNDILDLSKIQSGHMDLNLTDFDINQLVLHELDKFEQPIVDANIKLLLTLSPSKLLAHGDVDSIKRVVYNLIDNAVKFVEPHGTIEVKTELKENKYLIGIRNSCEPISEEVLDSIWNRFTKLDQSRGEVKHSSGLGLAIVKEIIKAHGEKIEVYSNESIGVLFVFSLSTQIFEHNKI